MNLTGLVCSCSSSYYYSCYYVCSYSGSCFFSIPFSCSCFRSFSSSSHSSWCSCSCSSLVLRHLAEEPAGDRRAKTGHQLWSNVRDIKHYIWFSYICFSHSKYCNRLTHMAYICHSTCLLSGWVYMLWCLGVCPSVFGCHIPDTSQRKANWSLKDPKMVNNYILLV